MLRRLMRGTALTVMLAFIGCVPSLHPLYTDKDCVLNPNLAGIWQPEEGKDTWAFTQRDAVSYNLVYTDDKGVSGNFVAHLVELQGITFMDIFPGDADPELKINALLAFQLVPCHFVARVGDIGPNLQLAFTNPDWTERFLEENPAALKHEIIQTGEGEERLVLTASTAELQKFWVEHSRTANAFGEPMQLKRVQQPAAPEQAPKEGAQ